MFDMHYDLLTKLYMCYKENNFTYIENWVKNYNINNVHGLIANLCFMSIDEMEEEYHKEYYDPNVSILEMFKICMDLLHKYVPSDIKVLTSIEGCDYLKIDELEELKNLGLNCIVPVWNNKSIYGSGNRSDTGLTPLGIELIKKAIELNIGIDLSHANEKTFYGILAVAEDYRKNGINPVIYASHSNVRSLSDIPRNLTDKQIKDLIKAGGKIGLFNNCNFVLKGSLSNKIKLIGTDDYNSYIEYLNASYIKHILYVKELTGSIDNICISTDDMDFSYGCMEYKYTSNFDYSCINIEIRRRLEPYFTEDEIDKILYKNAELIYNKLDCKDTNIMSNKHSSIMNDLINTGSNATEKLNIEKELNNTRVHIK